MGEVETSGTEFVVGAVDDVGEKLTLGLKQGLKDTHDTVGMAGLDLLANTAERDSKTSLGVVGGLGAGVKTFLRPIAEGARWAAEQARKVAAAAAAAAALAAKAAAEATKAAAAAAREVAKAARWAKEKAEAAAAAVAKTAKAGWSWFKSLF
jgi:hypothetical protein